MSCFFSLPKASDRTPGLLCFWKTPQIAVDRVAENVMAAQRKSIYGYAQNDSGATEHKESPKT